MKLWFLVLAGAGLMNAQSAESNLVDSYFAAYYALNPTSATAAGFHGVYDAQMDEVSASAFQKRIDLSRSFLPQFEKLPASSDRDLMISHLHAELVNLQDIRQQKTNPDFYSSSATSSIFGLISRNFASPEERLRDVIARERAIPQMFREAKRNLKNCPRIYTEVAIAQLPGIQSFFAQDVPKAFSAVQDQALLREFHAANDSVGNALSEYQAWLQKDLLPRSNGDFRTGSTNFSNKVKYEEMVDLPLPQLLQIGYANLHQNQEALRAVCKQIDPGETVTQVAHQIGKNHPPPADLLQSFRNTFDGLIQFIQSHHVITIPSAIRPILEETPPFMRALTTASMDTPGPYEKVATEACFNVTHPERTWTPKQTEEFMTAFNRGTIASTAVHEAYPGHYVQLLWFQQVKSKVRKLIGCGSNIEGWAHYTEQMMLDEGYGQGDRELRAGQLLDALLRNARYIVGIEMHTGKMSYEEGIQFFMREAYMSHDYAERETKRGTSDPTYLVYTLGKLQILKLRADYQAKMGSAYTLEKFHNEFMQGGGVPVKLIRRTMLGNDSSTLQ